MALRLTQEQYEEIIRRKDNIRPARLSVSPSDMEPDSCNEPVAKKKAAGPNSQCCIDIISYRHCLCDAEGISAKALIDGMVHAGILPDDSPEYVKEVRFAQEKIGKEETERTEVIIREAL